MDTRSLISLVLQAAILAALIVIAVRLGDQQPVDAPAASTSVDEAVADHLKRADALEKAARFEEALVAIESARVLAPRDPALQSASLRLWVERAARSAESIGPKDRAVVRYAAYSLGEEVPVAAVALAHLAARDGAHATARAHLERALAADKDYVPALIAAARLDLSDGELAKARARLEKAVELAPDDARARNDLGVVLVQLEEPEAATEHFRRAMSLAADAAVRINLGSALLKLSRHPEARDVLAGATGLAPTDARAWHLLGVAAQRVGDLTESTEALQRSVELSADPQVAYELALVLQEAQQFDRAAGVLQTVVQSDPTHVAAAYQLGATLQRIGDPEGARAALEHYVRLARELPSEAERVAEVTAVLSPPPPPADAPAP